MRGLHLATNHKRFAAHCSLRQSLLITPQDDTSATKAREIRVQLRRGAFTHAHSLSFSYRLSVSLSQSSLSTAINRARRNIFIYAPASNPPYTILSCLFSRSLSLPSVHN